MQGKCLALCSRSPCARTHLQQCNVSERTHGSRAQPPAGTNSNAVRFNPAPCTSCSSHIIISLVVATKNTGESAHRPSHGRARRGTTPTRRWKPQTSPAAPLPWSPLHPPCTATWRRCWPAPGTCCRWSRPSGCPTATAATARPAASPSGPAAAITPLCGALCDVFRSCCRGSCQQVEIPVAGSGSREWS